MLLTKKFIIGHFLVCLAALTCFLLSYWQFSRLSQRKEMNATIENRMAQKAQDFLTLLPGKNIKAIKDNNYRQIKAEGNYIERSEVLVASRTRDGEPGFNVLTGFEISKDAIVYINRGWIPQSLGDDIISGSVDNSLIEPIRGYKTKRTITGLIRLNEPKRPFSKNKKLTYKDNVDVRISTEDFSTLISTGKRSDIYPLWIQLTNDSRGHIRADSFPKLISKPELTLRNHLSYAIQWMSFGFIAIITWIILCIKAKKKAKL
ncbi:MAG: SURF1 family protein [Acidimicrobiia bacterium]